MQRLEEGTVGGPSGQTVSSGFEGQFDDDHGDDGTSDEQTACVSGDTADLRRRFGTVPLLQRLPVNAVEELWHASTPRYTPAGGTIVGQGSPANHLILLLTGAASSTAHTTHGRSVVLDSWTAPATLDKVVTFSGDPHPGTILATDAAWWCALPRTRLDELLKRHPDAYRHVLFMVHPLRGWRPAR